MKKKSVEKMPLKILYLEDSPRDIEMIQELLEDADYVLSMDCTAKKKEFNSMLLHREYDVILSDFKLPGFDAFGALELSKKICPEIPFICISGSIGEDIAIELIKKGAVDYVLKDRMVRLPLAIKRAIDETKEKKLLKIAEESLKESEKKFQVLAENSPVGIFQTDAKGATIYVNPKYCQISGLSMEEALGNDWINAVHKDDKENLSRSWKKATQTHNASKVEYRFVRKDKSIAWVIGQAVPEKDIQNRIIGYVGTVTEITERRRIEDALLQEQFLTTMLMENLPDNIYFKDRESRFLRISKNHAQKFGLDTPEKAIGKTDFDFFTKEHAQPAFEDEQRIMKTGKPIVGIEEKETWPDGKATWVSTTKLPLRDRNGRIIGTFGISRDISERKRSEEELLFKNIILSTQQEASIDGILVVDENLQIVSYNHRFVTMWGIPQELITQKNDKPVLELVTKKVKDSRAFIQKVEYLYKHKSETSHDEIVLKDGRIFDRYSAPMIGSKNRYYGRVWYFRDITEHKHAEEALKNSEIQYRMLFDQMTTGLAVHEIVLDDKNRPIDYRFLQVNPAFEKLTGLRAGTILGKTIREVLPGTEPSFIQHYGKVALSGKDIQFESYSQELKKHYDIRAYSPERGKFATIFEDITERKQAEQELKKSQEVYRSIFENTGNATMIVDENTNILLANNECLSATGYSPEKLIGTSWTKYVAPDSLEMMKRNSQMRIQKSESVPSRYDAHLINAKGEIRDTMLTIGLIPATRQSVVSMLDVTERKQAEIALAEETNRRRILFEQSPDGIVIIDTQTARFIEFNTAVHQQLGYTREEFSKLSIADVEAKERQEETRVTIKRAIHEGRLDFETLQRTKYGEIRNVHVTAQYLNILGTPVYQCIWRDITERKQAEEALRQSEEKYRNLIDNMKEGIFISDETGIIQFANKELARIHGYDNPDELKNKRFTDFIEQEVKDKIEHQIRETTDETKIAIQEFPIVKSDGSLAYVSVRSSPIFEEGLYVGTMGIVQDVTERKQTEDALRTSEEKFRKAFMTSPDAININRLFDGMFVSSNNGFTRLMEYTEEEVVGKTSVEIGIWYDHAERDKLIAGLKKDGVVVNYEARFLTKTGKVKYGMMSACVIELDKIPHILNITRDITERRHVEEALEMSEKKYRSIFENVQDVYYETTMDGTIIEVSPSVELISKGQFKRTDVIGKSMNEFYPDADARNTLMATLLQSGSVADFEVLLKNRDGSMIPCSISAKIYFDNQGQPERIIGSMRDVTLRKRAEDKLRESKVLYHSLVEELPAGVFRKDIEGRYVFVSPWFCRLKEMTEEEFLGKTPQEVAAYEEAKQNGTDLTIKYAAEGEKNHQIIMQTGKTIELDEEYTKFDGTKQFIHSTKMPVINSDGKIIGTQGLLFDITALKRAKEDIRKLSSAVEQSGSSVMITNLQGDIEYVNKKFVDVTGYSIQEVVGKNPNLLKSGHTPPEEYKVVWDTITKGEVWRGEFQNKKKNGELFWELATISPMRDSKGIVTHFIAVKEDITQQKIIEEQLRQVQKLEGLGTLAGGIAHDFNNILGIILAFITSIKRFKGDEKKLDVATETILTAVQRGKTLVQQILTFARKTETEFGPLHVNDAVMEIMTMIMETFPKILTYGQNIEKGIPLINADHSQLHQVLLNLCVNARDAMPKGGVLTINTRMVSGEALKNQHPDVQEGNFVCIEVSDTGEGMSEETRNRIFEPFFTTKGIGKGTGLGLAVVYGVVQTHKGYIDVDSELGKGTTFRLFLPVMQTAALVNEKVEETLEQIKGGTETLLVVEDEEMLIMSLEMVLIEKGYTVLLAGDGLKALQIYQENRKDIRLVITDYGLPNLTGIEVCQRIKQINPDEHLIVATGYLDPDMKNELQKTGVEKILYKPYDIKEVLKSVREVLDGI